MSLAGVETITVEYLSDPAYLAALTLSHPTDKKGTDLLQKVKANVYDNLGKRMLLMFHFKVSIL